MDLFFKDICNDLKKKQEARDIKQQTRELKEEDKNLSVFIIIKNANFGKLRQQALNFKINLACLRAFKTSFRSFLRNIFRKFLKLI